MEAARKIASTEQPEAAALGSGMTAGAGASAGQVIGQVWGTFFGLGYFPLGPGSLASAVTVLLFLVFWPAAASPLWLLPAAALLLAPAAWAAGVCERRAGASDPGHVVLDEVLGQMITLAAVPAALGLAAGWKYGLLGFVLFRIFDILKPFPIRRLERLPGGWGVMADDYGAGLYGFIVVRLAVRLAVWAG